MIEPYKGYSPVFRVDEDSGLVVGRVLGIEDIVTFEGESVARAYEEFKTSVDFYLEMCSELDKAPNEPRPGKFVVKRKKPKPRAARVLVPAEKSGVRPVATDDIEAALDRAIYKTMEYGHLGEVEAALRGARRLLIKQSTV